MSYVYIQSEPYLWTVGHYAPDGEWKPESDHDSPAAAAERTTQLNGGGVYRWPIDVQVIAESLRAYYAADAGDSNDAVNAAADDMAELLVSIAVFLDAKFVLPTREEAEARAGAE